MAKDKKKFTESIDITDECFNYYGAMNRDEAIELFNNMMKEGVYFDPDRPLRELKEKFKLSDKKIEQLREQLQNSFEEGSDQYGEYLFLILCTDRSTGFHSNMPEFRPVSGSPETEQEEFHEEDYMLVEED